MSFARRWSVLILITTFSFLFARIYLGPLHAPAWTGLVYVKDGDWIAFRIAFERAGQIADNYNTFYLISEVGPRSPEALYAKLGVDLCLPFGKGRNTPILNKNLTRKRQTLLEWARTERGFAGRLSGIRCARPIFIFYEPWFNKASYKWDGKKVVAQSGKLKLYFYFNNKVKIERVDQRELRLKVYPSEFEVRFYATENPSEKIKAAFIDEILKRGQRLYERSRPYWKGEWKGLIASITNNLFWMLLYQPDKNRIYLPAGRKWIFPAPDGTPDYWTIFEWDAFFNALEAAVENTQVALSEIEAVLDTQYPWGNIPNWRSARNGSPDRSQPPVGSFVVWRIYTRTGEKKFLEISYERLKKWYRFWTEPKKTSGTPRRDGNRNLLLEWGSDSDKLSSTPPVWERDADGRQRAAWESGQDDLPNFDGVKFNKRTETLEMDCLDLSSLHALDAWSLAKIARALGKKEESKKFERDYFRIKKAVNKILWNEKEGFYFDRFWDGRFSPHKASSNFYPLVAGIPDRTRAQLLLSHLLNEKEFWGEFVIPTISRDNPAFKDQQYWRGTIWPPTNYLVYQGLRRYGFDRVASEFALKSARLFLQSWRKYALCRENYNSITGRGGGQRYQSWGPLFALILLEDFIDWSPWEGFRVSNLSARAYNEIGNLLLRGDRYRLVADREKLLLYRNGKLVLKLEGKAVLKRIVHRKDKLSFQLRAFTECKITAGLKGKSYRVKIGEKEFLSSSPEIKVSRGIWKISIKAL